MKKRLNLLCFCVIAAFLLSLSGSIQMTVQMFLNGMEAGMKAAEKGEVTQIPNYKTVYTIPTDMFQAKTGTVTNLKDGSELDIKPILSMIECPQAKGSTENPLFSIAIGLTLLVCFLYALTCFCKLILHINRNIVFDWSNVKYLRRIGWSLIIMFAGAFFHTWLANQQVAEVVELAGSQFSVLLIFTEPTFILGFISLLAAEVVAIGLRIKEENDLTI